MSIKDKFIESQLRKEYVQFKGSKFIAVCSLHHLNENEKNAVLQIIKVENEASDTFELNNINKSDTIIWAIDKASEFIQAADLVYLGERHGFMIHLEITEPGLFLKEIFKNKDTVDALIINKTKRLCIALTEEEYNEIFIVKEIKQ